MLVEEVYQGHHILDCALSHPLFLFNVFDNLGDQGAISNLSCTRVTSFEEKYQVFDRLRVELLDGILDSLLDFGPEQG